MNFIQIILLAIALSIDAMAVSFSQGLIFKKNKRKNSLILAFFLGFFQFLMPILGYFLSYTVYEYLKIVNTWIVFGIFIFLGIKFIKEAFEEKRTPSCISMACLLLIGIATSIDAFSAGISLMLAGNHIAKPALLIGLITFVNSIGGFNLAKFFRKLPSKALEITAGAALILLGFKALI